MKNLQFSSKIKIKGISSPMQVNFFADCGSIDPVTGYKVRCWLDENTGFDVRLENRRQDGFRFQIRDEYLLPAWLTGDQELRAKLNREIESRH